MVERARLEERRMELRGMGEREARDQTSITNTECDHRKRKRRSVILGRKKRNRLGENSILIIDI